MNPYNGFTDAQRNKAQRWLNAQWAAGAFPRPSKCCACGQTAGIIDAHAEDYSEPFAHGKTDQYPLCFICHMMVHCRFRSPAAWSWYRAMVADGLRFDPYPGRNFPGFQRDFLKLRFENRGSTKLPPYIIGPKPARRVLDGIEGRGSTGPNHKPRGLA